jgi:hypothetical protein
MVVTREPSVANPVPTLPLPPDAEALFREARRRERRRRIAMAVVVIMAALVAGLVVVFAARGDPGRRASTGVNSPAPVPSPPVPRFLVVHAPTATASPGAIEVIDTVTGRVVRTLGSAYDPYLLNGFQLSANRSTLYYTRLNEAAQTIEIVAVAVTGGPSRVIAHGVGPQFSADGTMMSFEPYGQGQTIAILNLGKGQTVDAHIPSTSTSQVVFSSSWLPNSRQLLVIVGSPYESCTGPPGSSCGRTPPPPPPVAYLLNVTNRLSWSRVSAPSTLSGGWTHLSLQGPGPIPGTVLATIDSSDRGAITTVQISTGRILSQLPLPNGTSFLARDRSGTHFLLSDAQATVRWSPPDHSLQIVGPAAAEAGW